MIVPDGIEPVEAWRGWNLDKDGRLIALHFTSESWKPGEPFHASCSYAESYRWELRRNGGSLEQARQQAESHNSVPSLSFGARGYHRAFVPVPSVEPPEGLGYFLRREQHHAPSEGCSCGVYAANSKSTVPPAQVVGKVKLWGKIVPGELGYRAEYAYPSELHVPQKMASKVADYGVPLILTTEPVLGITPGWSNRRLRTVMLVATGANVGALIANLATHYL